MKNREYGLDLARIVSMVGIIILHILGSGGLLANNNPGIGKYWVYWYIEIFSFSSVDLFALLTGWLDARQGNIVRKPSTFRLIELLLIVFFYSFLITIIFLIFFPNKVQGIKEIVMGLFPMLFGRYWYITCYIPIALIKPYLSKSLNELSIRLHKKICLLLIIIFSIIPTLSMIDLFAIKWGYSTMWLFICYIIGSYLNRIQNSIKFSSKRLLMIFFGISVLLLLLKIVAWNFGSENVGRFIEYTSPFILLNACIALLFFSKIKIRLGSKCLCLLSSVAFDVYIIHCHIFIYDFILNSNFLWINNFSFYLIPVIIIGLAIICYIALSCIGIIRNYIFNTMSDNYVVSLVVKKIDNIFY